MDRATVVDQIHQFAAEFAASSERAAGGSSSNLLDQ